MDRLKRLHLTARSTYYLGWITAFLAALLHIIKHDNLLLAINISSRNMLEASVVFFLACAASELRAQGIVAQMLHGVQEQKAA